MSKEDQIMELIEQYGGLMVGIINSGYWIKLLGLFKERIIRNGKMILNTLMVKIRNKNMNGRQELLHKINQMNRKSFINSLIGLPFVAPLLAKAKSSTSLERRVWKPEDIKGGLYIVRASAGAITTRPGYLTTVTYQIGYNTQFHQFRHYCLNSIADGCTHGDINQMIKDKYFSGQGYSKFTLVDYLNADEYGYRPATKQELHSIIDYCSKNFLS